MVSRSWVPHTTLSIHLGCCLVRCSSRSTATASDSPAPSPTLPPPPPRHAALSPPSLTIGSPPSPTRRTDRQPTLRIPVPTTQRLTTLYRPGGTRHGTLVQSSKRNESGEETHRPSSRSHRLWSPRSVCGGTGHRHPTTPPPPPQPPLSASRPAHLASPPRLTHAGSLMPEEVGCIPPLHLQPGPTTPSLPPPPHQTPPPQPDPVVHGRGSRQRWRKRSWGDRHPCGRG